MLCLTHKTPDTLSSVPSPRQNSPPRTLAPSTHNLEVRTPVPLLPDPFVQRLSVDLNLHLLLRLHHVGAEETALAIGEKLLAEAIPRRRDVGIGCLLFFEHLEDCGTVGRGNG